MKPRWIACIIISMTLFAIFMVMGGDQGTMDMKMLREKLRENQRNMEEMNTLLERKKMELENLQSKLKNGEQSEVQLKQHLARLNELDQRLSDKSQEIFAQESKINNLMKGLDEKDKKLESQNNTIANILKQNSDQNMQENEKNFFLHLLNRTGPPQSDLKIPRIAHMLFPEPKDYFNFAAYLTAKSVLMHFKPTKFLVHLGPHVEEEDLFSNPKTPADQQKLIDSVKPLFTVVPLEPLKQQTSSTPKLGHSLRRRTTAKLEILKTHGGLVIDAGTFLVKNMLPLLSHAGNTTAMIVGEKVNGELGLECVLTRKNHILWRNLHEMFIKAPYSVSSRLITRTLRTYSRQMASDLHVIAFPRFYALDSLSMMHLWSEKKQDNRWNQWRMNKVQSLKGYAVVFPMSFRIRSAKAITDRESTNVLVSTMQKLVKADLKDVLDEG